MSTFEAEHSNERILPNGGMALAGAILKQGGFREALNQLDVTGKRSGNQIKDGDPEFYELCPGAERLPSEAALRQRMDKTGESRRGAILRSCIQKRKASILSPKKNAKNAET